MAGETANTKKRRNALTEVRSRGAVSQKATARAADSFSTSVRGAEMVVTNDLKVALALQYAPGTTPLVLAMGKGKNAENIVWSAQHYKVPIVELTSLQTTDLAEFVVGEEIPERFYRPMAQALALLYKSVPAPGMVRFLRVVSNKRQRPPDSQPLADILTIPPLYVEIGRGIVPHQEDLGDPIAHLRQRIAMDMGLILPRIPLRFNPQLEDSRFTIRLRDVPIQEGYVELPVDTPDKLYVLVNRLKQVIHQNGWELVGYLEVEELLEIVRKNNPGLVRALFPDNYSVSALRQILRNLLREQLSIRDLSAILEVIVDNLARSQDPDLLTECVRMAYSRSLCHKYQDGEGFLNALLLDPDVERMLLGSLQETAGVRWMDLSPEDMLRFLRALETSVKTSATLALSPVLLTTPVLRRFLSRLTESVFNELPVLSYNEIAPLTEVRSIGTVNF